MDRLVNVLVAAWLTACSAHRGQAPRPLPPSPVVHPLPAPAPAPLPAPSPVAPAGGCTADNDHCCMPDGRVVRPGGCAPSYPDDVEPATTRAADGTCARIPCHLRCLPEGALIATPTGEVPVEELEVGDAVWTMDATGSRIAAAVALVASVPIVGAHTLLEVSLRDGRVVRASFGHPTADGTPIEALTPGSLLDGAIIARVRQLPFRGKRTGSLPGGPTGAYWANGVLLGSTLAPVRSP